MQSCKESYALLVALLSWENQGELEEKRADNRLPICKRQVEGWRPVKEGDAAVSDRAEPGGGAQYHWVREGQSPCSSANHSKGVK